METCVSARRAIYTRRNNSYKTRTIHVADYVYRIAEYETFMDFLAHKSGVHWLIVLHKMHPCTLLPACDEAPIDDCKGLNNADGRQKVVHEPTTCAAVPL